MTEDRLSWRPARERKFNPLEVDDRTDAPFGRNLWWGQASPRRCWHLAMKRAPDAEDSPLRRHAADALRRARKLPIGHERNDLRQLAMGLLWLERKGLQPMIQDRLDAALTTKDFRE